MDKNIVVTVKREYESKGGGGWTLGTMSIADTAKTKLFTCEDEGREVKVPGETRVPAGIYKLGYNTTGGMNVSYKKKFPALHKGMIEIKDIVTLNMKFGNVYIHIGNKEKDTDGCPLLGMTRDAKKGEVYQSTLAYTIFYKSITQILDKALRAKEDVYIEIIDIPKAVVSKDAEVKPTVVATPKAAVSKDAEVKPAVVATPSPAKTATTATKAAKKK